MASTRANTAITKDGETYNKLQRPDDYLISTTPCLPPKPIPFEIYSNKRKRDRENAPGGKRSKMEGKDEGKQARAVGSYEECGMRTILPGLDDEGVDGEVDEAVAYLRGVRWVLFSLAMASADFCDQS